MMFCFCAAVTAITLLLQPIEPFVLAYLSYRSFGVMPLLNFFPIFGVCLFLFYLTRSLAVSTCVPGYTALAMAVVNRMKLLLRGDPLLHWDFTMAAEAIGVAGQVDPRLLPFALMSLLLTAVLVAWIHSKVCVQKIPVIRRVFCALTCAVALFLTNQTVYKSRTLNQWLSVYGSFYNAADIHNSKGNLYSFLYNYNSHKNVQPAGYDPGRVLAAMAEENETAEALLSGVNRPHIVMVMAEAFSDISEREAFNFSGRRNPLETFLALGEDGITGSIVVPSRGGGTADTEFDVLTGRASRYFRTAPYAYRLVTGPTEAIPSLLAKAGYASFALHPGYRWFYNRQNVYSSLG
ncbi:MAG: sulfatase-like hydrolase/transferase, partial [Clostridia bacterium]|nr:sulfatase-like hydrolase/transferase [Clostridia bacterium]